VRPRVGVVGHVEWIEFAVVERVPSRGEIVHARAWFAEPAGGGAVAAAWLRELAGASTLFTALGSCELGDRARRELQDRLGVHVYAARRDEPQRRGFTFLDDGAERTITVLGPRCVPRLEDPLPWDALAGFDALYFTGGDADALRAARAARVLVATPRAIEVIREAGVELDVLVGSGNDPGEALDAALDPPPRHVVLTAGARGGRWTGADGTTGAWAAAAVPGEPVDSYGCGDSFAAGLTYGLGAGQSLEEALRTGARAGAACLARRGPYGLPSPSARRSAS
jgi:ribokinase